MSHSMEVEIVSREYIRPSSPTPEHLQTYRLSLWDQYAPTLYFPQVLFYRLAETTGCALERLQVLRKSLSETLTHFYPFAGRVRDSLSILCCDEGALFIEARTDSCMDSFLKQPDLSLIRKFIPLETTWVGAKPGSTVAWLQVTVFSCGSLAVSTSISHIVSDGFTHMSFLKCWASIARKASEAVALRFDFNIPLAFPHMERFPMEGISDFVLLPFFRKGVCGTRRVVFDAAAIAQLKAKATSSSVQNPSKVEVVSALIWRCAILAWKTKHGFQRPCLLTQAVNLRGRNVPQSVNNSMGNLFWNMPVLCSSSEIELDHLVSQLRDAIKKLNGGFVKRLESEGGQHKLCHIVKEIGQDFSGRASSDEGVDFLGFTSWCRFGQNEVDFGWGKPTWMATAAAPAIQCHFVNFVLLLDAPQDGIEAWVNLDENTLAILEDNNEILQYASLNPSVLSFIPVC